MGRCVKVCPWCVGVPLVCRCVPGVRVVPAVLLCPCV